MDIKAMVVLCVTILGGVVAISMAAVVLAYRRKARRGQEPFSNAVVARIIAAVAMVFAAIYLAAADALTEPLMVLLAAIVGFLLGGAVHPPRPGRDGERDGSDRRGETAG
jgi:uncharacterized membrane protein (DUF4010 family)